MPDSVKTVALKPAGATARFATANFPLLLLVAGLSGCASQSLRTGADNPAQVTNSINLSGFPPEYKRGFGAGCENAKYASSGAAPRPKGDASFVQGWQDGLDYCRPRKPR
jgi:hypothetical protein